MFWNPNPFNQKPVIMRKTRASRYAHSTVAEVQQLEAKQVLTGTVAVALSGNNVVITGDNESNDVQFLVDSAAGLTVVGLNGTLIKVGNAAPVAAPPVVPLPSFVNDVLVNLNGGDDGLTVETSGVLSLRDVNVKTGAGNDSLTLISRGSLELRGDFKTDTSSGNDTVKIDPVVSIDVYGSVIIDTGSGEDNVGLVDSIKTGPPQTGASFRDLLNDSAFSGNQFLEIANDLKISTGGDDDSVAILGVEVGRNLVVNSGFGHADNLGMSNVRVNGNLDLIYGDTNVLTDVFVGGKLKARSGTGDDQFALSDITAGAIDIDLGSGRDQIAIRSVSSPDFKVKGGPGKDQIFAVNSPGVRFSSFDGHSVNKGLFDDVVQELVASGLL